MSNHIKRWSDAAAAYSKHSPPTHRWEKLPPQIARFHDEVLEQLATPTLKTAQYLLRQSHRRIHLGTVNGQKKHSCKISIHFDADGFGVALHHPDENPEEVPVVRRVDLCDIVVMLTHELGHKVNDLMQRILEQVDRIAEQAPKPA